VLTGDTFLCWPGSDKRPNNGLQPTAAGA
jgi:hypothetical protein